MLPPAVIAILCGALLFIAPHKEQEQRKEQKAVVEKQAVLNPVSIVRNEDGSGTIYAVNDNNRKEGKELYLALWREGRSVIIPPIKTSKDSDGKVWYKFTVPGDTVESMILNYGTNASWHEDAWWKFTPEQLVHGNFVTDIPVVTPWRLLSYGACIILILIGGAVVWHRRQRRSNVLYVEAVRYDGPKEGDIVIDG